MDDDFKEARNQREFPYAAGWLDDYLDELSTFPSAAHDDYVDSTTQALNRINEPVTGPAAFIEFYRRQVWKMYEGEHETDHRSQKSECPGNDCTVMREIIENARKRRWPRG